jgi:hypothetical protein
MKRLLIVMFLLLWGAIASAPIHQELILPVDTPICPLKRLSGVVAWVESKNNPNALNRLENAVGLYQIRPIRLKDYNQRTQSHYKLKDCYDPKINKMIWNYYANQFYPTDYEAICKAWNGKGRSNKIYWATVKKRLEKDAKTPLK